KRLSTESSHLLFWESLRRRNDRQQEVWPATRDEMQRVAAVEYRRRPIVRIDMQERPDAFHWVGRVRRRGILAVDLIVLAADRQSHAIAGRDHDRRRPYLDVELDGRARSERPFFIVRVPGPVRAGELGIKFAMRRAQPAKSHRNARIVGAD